MLSSDTVIEKSRFFLRNLNTTAKGVAADVWSAATSSYGMYYYYYEDKLRFDNYYYVSCVYKFTTTNQSPTWVTMYSQNGSATWSGATVYNPVAGTEYKLSSVSMPSTTTAAALNYGTVYNGNYNAINGISAQVKNVMIYDVQELFELLRAAGVVTNAAGMKTWCDANLVYHPPYENYEITSLILSSALAKISMKGGVVAADEFIEPDGMRFFASPNTNSTNQYFDLGTSAGISVYNNQSNGTVTHTIIDGLAQNSPFYPQHKKILQITTNGTASPGAGGFVATHIAAANKIFVEKFVAKIPVGYTVYSAYNSQGTGASVSFISSRAGTGDWQEYTILYKCGSEGSFSNGGHVYISGSNNTSVTWYVAYISNSDITGYEYLKNFSVLGNTDRIKGGTYFSRKFDTENLCPQFNGTNLFTLPSTWSWDTTDIAGEGKASIVQPVNAGALSLLGDYWFPVSPGQRYKISMWIKCKRDMSSFLVGIRMRCNGVEVAHTQVHYKNGTYTQLTQDLKAGDTSMKVASNANWGSYSYSKVGARNNRYNSSYNNFLTGPGYNNATGFIAGVSGSDTVTFNTAYSGTIIPSGKYVVESYDGGNYPYPIQKGNLPTDNTWKYVEGYFGGDSLWDGNNSIGQWGALPFQVTDIGIYLNLYTNNGTVPIKYCDIKIEPASLGAGVHRVNNKLQIIGGN